MHHLFLAEVHEGPCFVGTSAHTTRGLAMAMVRRDDTRMRLLRDWPMKKHMAEFIRVSILRSYSAAGLVEDLWISEDAGRIEALIDATIGLIDQPYDHAHSAATMLAMREELFQTTQEVFAELAGVSKSTVWRWESGDIKPVWQHLARLRYVAQSLGLPWKDEYAFTPIPIAPPPGSGVVIPFNRTGGKPNV